jgi:hypothetical protein
MNKKISLCEVLFIASFLLISSWIPVVSVASKGNTTVDASRTANVTIDVPYIYNLTAALSNIVFTAYNKSNGEIAKGRAYGTKGEHKAAEILYENMTLLGLHPVLQQLGKRPGVPHDDLVTQLEVLSYDVKLNGNTLDCFMSPSWKGPHGNPHELNCTFSYKGLQVKPVPLHPCVYNRTIAKDTADFVFLGRDQWNDPSGVLPVVDLLKPYLNPLKFYILFHITSLFNILRDTAAWYRMYPHCKALLLYDFNPECHDFVFLPRNGNSLPVIFITGNDGRQMLSNLTGSSVDFELTQRYNTSVISYNVIGELKGKDEGKTVILSCLYDGWWDQGTADAAIGMAMVLGIAKYFVQAGITPKYTVKFIGFSGEEYDILGAKYYAATHRNETILAVIDLNQLGFTQNNPRLTLDFVANKYPFIKQVWDIVNRTHYVERTGNVTDVKPIWWPSGSIPGNAAAFATKLPRITAMSIFKDGGWTLHHRDGKNHTEGDVLTYFNWTDTLVTAEIITNITLAFALGNQDSTISTSPPQVLETNLREEQGQ